MIRYVRTIKLHWAPVDSFVTATTTLALLAFIGNIWWESVWVCYAASAVPLTGQLLWAFWRVDHLLNRALVFGGLVGAAWPVGEAVVTAAFGWWGKYVAPGPMILHTPLYCVLIGWLASSYLFFMGDRLAAMGFTSRVRVGVTAVNAFLIGIIGENLFVAANMWHYTPSWQDVGHVPVFVPVAYAMGYGVLPLLAHRSMGFVFAGWTVATLGASILLGVATGFFPQ